jgi:hypothetical protein
MKKVWAGGFGKIDIEKLLRARVLICFLPKPSEGAQQL